MLTHLTSQAGEERRITVQGFDLPRRLTLVALASGAAGLAPTLVLWSLLGQLSLAIVVLSVGAGFLLDSRTTTGLKQRRAVALLDAKRANTGRFLVCGTEIHPGSTHERTLRVSSVPVPPADPRASVAALFAGAPR